MTFLKSIAKAVINPIRRHRLLHYGRRRYCPCCKAHLRRFRPHGLVPRLEAKCPVCGALERHRLMYLFLSERTDLFDGVPKKMLHVAPEPQLSRIFQKAAGIDYLSADLDSPHAMVKMDITNIEYPDGAFDVIYCSHVLEHVLDDRQAMREFYRVLKPGGWAILQVPITAPATFEDPTVTDPRERERLFGQSDHVRRYGPDYPSRLVEAGFAVSLDDYVRELDEETVHRLGLLRDDTIYLCRKEKNRGPSSRIIPG